MGQFVKGDVVVVPFPFSDLSSSKRRPALVLVGSQGRDLILAQITGQNAFDEVAVSIRPGDIEVGKMGGRSNGLSVPSNVRPNKLFTADESIVLYKVGTLSISKLYQVVRQVVSLLSQQ